MKLGRWIVLALITLLVSCSVSAYQVQQQDDEVRVAQSASMGHSVEAMPEGASNPTLHFTNENDGVNYAFDSGSGLSEGASQVWLLELPQHWVQHGECQVRGTLKTLLVQEGDRLSGRLHWVWNGQNDAATFTGILSDQRVQMQMSPPKVGGFGISFEGRTNGAGRFEGTAVAKSICKNKNGAFALTPLSRPQPSSHAKSLPLFQKPFEGEYLISNYFDHDQPRQFVDNNGFLTNWKGDRLSLGHPGAGIDGHGGYDWGLPENTPLKAVTDGVVTFAGEGRSFFCPPLEQETTGNYVYILHTAPSGEQFETEYVHLSQVDVKKGDRVTAGQTIGLSGNTGCSTGPHLHFGVRRVTPETGAKTLVDPYGWNAVTDDPWSQSQIGHESLWLWRPQQAPLLYEYGR